MINFIIYSDDNSFVKRIKNIIDNIMFKNDETYQIKCFNKNCEILKQSDNKVYILDIDSLGEDGFKIADEIRKDDYESILIVNTNFDSKYMHILLSSTYLIFSVINYENASRNLSNIISYILKVKKQKEILQIKSNGVIFRIRYNSILYIVSEKMNHRISIVTENNIYTINGTLNEIKNKLKNDFVYSHRSCIVNVSRIVCINKRKRTITFDNGTELELLSFRCANEIENNI